jgi:replicative DNA helicase
MGMGSLKVPPHSVEAEISMLGGLMLDNEAWLQVAGRVDEGDFYRKDHGLIFRAIGALESQGRPFDIVTVAEWLEGQQRLEEAGGFAYLANLAESTPTTANIVTYADIVRGRSVLRQLAHVANEVADSVYNPQGRDNQEILELAEQKIFEISERHNRGRRTYRAIRELLSGALDRIDRLYQLNSPITGVATGFTDFDLMTSGLQPADLVIVAGRPSMGKTAFAVNIAEHAAIKDKLAVAVFSMEMPGEQLAMRMMSSLGRIDQHKVRTGKLSDDDWPRLTSAVSILSEVNLFIDDSPALTPTDLRARCRRLKRDRGLDLVIIDYLQLMQVNGTKENRATEISEISRSLKAMAKELYVPVIALSQLNRSLESRTDKRPVMSDLRESGAIEQDADLIVFIYRDEVYNDESDRKGIAEIIISKQRNGPIGTAHLAFLGHYTRFENLAPETFQPPSGQFGPGGSSSSSGAGQGSGGGGKAGFAGGKRSPRGA